MYMYVYMYMYMYMCIYIYIYTYVYIYIYIYIQKIMYCNTIYNRYSNEFVLCVYIYIYVVSISCLAGHCTIRGIPLMFGSRGPLVPLAAKC